jgi:hypothetical protein
LYRFLFTATVLRFQFNHGERREKIADLGSLGTALSIIPASATKMNGKGYNFNTGSHPSAKRFERFQRTGK